MIVINWWLFAALVIGYLFVLKQHKITQTELSVYFEEKNT